MATQKVSYRSWRRPNWRRIATVTPVALLMLAALITTPPATVAAVTPSVSIAQYPLTVAVPAHPQVLFAVGNSQSMDGDLSGAILTGSGGLSAAYSALNASSSPLNYTVPTSFTAPVTGTTAGNSAPYTVKVAGIEYDNSASRLNVAKAGLTSILQNFLSNADFGLIDYQTTAPSEGSTWVYYMSQAGGFTFTNTADANSVANPCYNVPVLNALYPNCGTLSAHYGYDITPYQYMEIATTSDDPSISDVLYAPVGWGTPLFITYGGPTPASPFGPPYSLTSYNNGSVEECYSTSRPSIGGVCETPTNAGYVPYSTEVMNVLRGFGYWTPGGQTHAPASPTSWAPLVPMTSAGQVPTAATVSAAEAVFSSYLQPETDNTGTSEIKAVATQSPIAGLLKAAGDYYSADNPPSTNGCTPNRYVVLVTDGLPTLDLAGHNWPPLGSASASGYGVSATFNGDGSLDTTNDQALTDTINTLTTLNSTAGGNIKTYVIALGAGVNPATIAGQTMTAMAVAGGTNTYFSAQNVTQLDQAMQVILAQILAETAATASSAVNSTGINTTSVAYQGTFTTSDTYQDWTGNLMAYPINATTGDIDTLDSDAKWSAQALLDAQLPGNRLIATWDPVAGRGVPFEWNPSTTAINGIASSTAMGQALMTFAPDTNGQDVLNYLRGDTSLEKRNGGQFRNRSHILGDIVDSSPLYVGGPSAPWQQSSYFSFQAMYAHREPLIYIGANDGMLHAFDANTGQEKFAYIPEGVYGNMVNLANPYYNEQHHFYVDGSPTAADLQFSDGSWHTILLGSERAGGSTIFALDVTDPSLFTSETAVGQAALWEFTDGDMGLTYSTPVAVNTTAGFAVVFGNGYDSPNNKPVLYALNPQTGATMAKIDLCAAVASTVPTACNASLPNGLSSVVAMNTTGAFLSGTSNVLYAGDLQGNLWRVDISNSNPTLWSVSVLFQARDPASGNPQPITVTPAVTLNPLIPTLTGTMVYFATGELLGIPDLSNTQVQSVYGIFDSGTAPSAPLTRTDLQVQTMSSVDVTTTEMVMTTIRLLTSNPVNLPVKHGWFVDLNLVAGERVVTDPALVNGTVQLTSYQPNTSTCEGGGNGWYMVFDYATGGATDAAQFGWNNSDSISSADLYMGHTVSGVSEGAVYAAGPKMVTGAGGAVVYTTSGGAEITTGANAGECTSISGTTTSCIPKWQNADAVAHGAWQEIR